MKKYKLIKWYPSLPSNVKEGDTFTKEKNGNTYYGKSLNTFVYNREVENNPGFWQEIVEKDYEILSLITNNKTVLNTPFFCIDDLLKNQNCNIHSVKRLS